MSRGEPVVEVRGLHKYYGAFHAVKGVSFTVPRSTVFGLLGPNGAGKTTTLKVLVGLLNPSSGSVLVGGRPAGSLDAKSMLGYAPERFSITGSWRLLDFMVYVGVLYGLTRREAEEEALGLLEWAGLGGWEHERFSELSAGMKRRLGIAQALMGNPDILVLDEPTEHLDALGRLELLNKVGELASRGKTVLLSTHVLAEAEMIVTHFAIMHRGRLLYQGSLDELSGGGLVRVEVDKPHVLSRLLEKLGVKHTVLGNRLLVEGEGVDELVLRLCLDNHVRVRRFEAGGMMLSEFFVKLVEGEGSEA
jgi:ABC-2 type transport system ATP-binding protein